MGKATGLDCGGAEILAIELDGSVKKPRLTKFRLESRPAGAEAADIAVATQHALKDGGLSREGIRYGFPCREAVLRTIDVPFTGRDAIRKVIKFEAEGSIHSHNVDDMVVDFLELSTAPGTTKVLVAAVPKAPLRETIEAFDRVGVEAEIVDLDTMALYRTAQWAGAFGELGADVDGEDGDDAGDDSAAIVTADSATAMPSRLVVDIGERSTRVLVVQGGRLIDMRTLRFGCDAVAEDVVTAQGGGLGLDAARDAVDRCLASGGDVEIGDAEFAVVEDEGFDDESGDEDEERDGEPERLTSGPAAEVAFATVDSARSRFLARLRRELVRFATGVPTLSEVEALWVTGVGSRMAGVDEVLTDVFEVEPRELDVLGGLRHSLDEADADDLAPRLAVAVGLALPGLGGAGGFNFRQEDLAFARQFDRLKFPLAIAAMLALFLSVLFVAKSVTKLRELEREYGATISVNEGGGGRRGGSRVTAEFRGYVRAFMDRKAGWFSSGNFYTPEEYERLTKKLLKADVFKRLPAIRNDIAAKLKRMQTQFGQFTEFRLSSGLGALNELATALDAIEDQLGRYLVTSIDLNVAPIDRSRKLVFDIALRETAEGGFRDKFETLERHFRRRIEEVENSAFVAVSGKPGKQFNSEEGPGSYYEVTLTLRPEKEFPVFPPETNQ